MYFVLIEVDTWKRIGGTKYNNGEETIKFIKFGKEKATITWDAKITDPKVKEKNRKLY